MTEYIELEFLLRIYMNTHPLFVDMHPEEPLFTYPIGTTADTILEDMKTFLA